MGGFLYTDKKILETLKRCAGPDNHLSITRYDRVREPGDPTAQRITQRYGSWNNAIRFAGLTENDASEGTAAFNHARRISEDECLSAVRGAAIALGPAPLTYARYCEYARGTGLPSGNTIRNRLGRWSETLRKMGLPARTYTYKS